MEDFQVFIKTEQEEMEDVSMHHTPSRLEDAPSTEPVKSERCLWLIITYLFELNLCIFWEKIKAWIFLNLLFKAFFSNGFSSIKTEVDPWQLLETDLVEGCDPLVLDR
jgi:hypothetical protein